jgi:hypothetical protein
LRGFAAVVIAAIAAGSVVIFVLGARVVVEDQDLTCPAGTAVAYASIASWTAQCVPSQGGPGSTIPIRRFVGLFFTNVDVRVFDVEDGNMHGPGLNVRLGR